MSLYAASAICQIESTKALSSKSFSEKYHEQKPIRIEGGASRWAKLGLNSKTFAKRYGEFNVTLRDPELLRSQSHAAPAVRSLTVESYIGTLKHQKLPAFENKFTDLTRTLRAELDPRGLPVDRVRATPILSFGARNTGVGLHAHGQNWLAQIQGRKMWVLAEPRGDENDPKMPDVQQHICKLRTADFYRVPDLRRCVTKPGDILYLPNQWWHGTCNLDDWTLAVGGERDTFDWPEAQLAVIDGDENRLRQLAAEDPAIIRYSPLAHIAAMKGDVAMLSVLDKLGSDLTLTSEGQGRPVDVACLWGHLRAVKFLVDKDASSLSAAPDVGIDGMSLLHLGAGYNHPDIVHWLLAQTAVDHLARDDRRRIPLHYAAADGRLDMVRELIANGRGGGDIPDYEGITPTEAAANRGHTDVVELLQILPDKRNAYEL